MSRVWVGRVEKGLVERGKTGLMRIAVLNFFDKNYTQVGQIGAPNKLEYCLQHGYDYILERQTTATERPAAWNKLEMLRRYLPYYDWVFWNDADTLICNMEQRLEDLLDPDYALVTGSDGGGNCINTGNFLMQRGASSKALLRRWWWQTDWINHPLWEQQGLSELVAGNERWRNMVKVLPPRAMNSYPDYNYQQGDFLVHFAGWGSQDRGRLVEMMREWASEKRLAA